MQPQTYKTQSDMVPPDYCIPVVITTAHRGVFFGYIAPSDECNKTLVVWRCRNCLSWASDSKGFLGLGAVGPIGEARIGPAVRRIILHDVTAIFDVEPAAVLVWETAPF